MAAISFRCRQHNIAHGLLLTSWEQSLSICVGSMDRYLHSNYILRRSGSTYHENDQNPTVGQQEANVTVGWQQKTFMFHSIYAVADLLCGRHSRCSCSQPQPRGYSGHPFGERVATSRRAGRKRMLAISMFSIRYVFLCLSLS